jgi:hypothetical protein
MYALIKNGAVAKYPYSLTDLRFANPNVSFPPNDDAAYEAFGMVRVVNSPAPNYNAATERLKDGTPVFDMNAQRWVQVWEIVALSAQEIADTESAARAINEEQAKQQLIDTDWADLPSVRDNNVTPHLVNAAEFDAYRLALRAIVINPPVVVAQWPPRPQANWSALP